MQLMRNNLKVVIVIYLVFCVVPLAFAATKPSFLTSAGDAEQKASNGITSAINWASVLAVGFGTLAIILGGVMLVPLLGRQQQAKFWFLGGSGAIIVGVAGLAFASWLYDKLM